MPYSVITFKTAQAMARFVCRLREMRPAVSDARLADQGPLVYFDFFENTATILDSRWPSTDLKDALWDMRISSTVNVFHQFKIKFATEQEERHFIADCKANGVKFGGGRTVTPKFRLASSTLTDPATVEGIRFDDVYQEWIATRSYDGFKFEMCAYGNRDSAAMACAQFEYLISLIPTQE